MIRRKKPVIIAVTDGYDGLSSAMTSWNFSMCLSGFGYQTILIQTDASPLDFNKGIRQQLIHYLQSTSIPYLQTLVLPVENRANRNQQFETFIKSIHSLPAEYIILDLGNSGTEFDRIALAFSDIPLYVITDEPASVIRAYSLIRSTLLTKLNLYINNPEIQKAFETCGKLLDGPFIQTISNHIYKLGKLNPFYYQKAILCKRSFFPNTFLLSRKEKSKTNYQQLLQAAVKEYLDISLNGWGTICNMNHLFNRKRTAFRARFWEYNSRILSMVVRHILSVNCDATAFSELLYEQGFHHILKQAENVKHDELISLN